MAYVYKHIRLDNGDVFYIGIGNDKTYKRAKSKFDRNTHWKNIVNKCGFIFEIIYDNITWKDACEKEKELINILGRRDRNMGNLVNMTNGGEGIVGLIQTDEHKLKNSLAHKGKKKSKETIEKMKQKILSEDNKKKLIGSHLGKKISDQTRKKISESLKGKFAGEKNPFYGKSHSDKFKKMMSEKKSGIKLSQETKNKISKSNKGKSKSPFSENTKLKMKEASLKRKARPPSRLGIKHSLETRLKMSKSHILINNNGPKI